MKQLLAALLALTGSGALAGDGLFGTPDARAALGAEIRALLTEEPEIVGRVLSPDPYAGDKEADLTLLEALAPELFGSGRPGWGAAGRPAIVILTEVGCPGCREAELDLAGLAHALGVNAAVLDLGPRAALLAALHLDYGPEDWMRARGWLHLDPALSDAEVFARLGRAPVAPLEDVAARDAALAARLGLDVVPSYVLPRMMIRGEMPVFALERYLQR